jgi:hypothetical protein
VRHTTSALPDFEPAHEALLHSGELPRGTELIRIRTELLELTRAYCPAGLAEAEALLERAKMESEE